MRSFLLALTLSAPLIATGAGASEVQAPASKPVDLVIALDTSGSMSNLIDSARQRLWDIVNEIGQARPTPDLRIALLSFGNPTHGADAGYVNVDQPFTRDLDAVNRVLFGYTTAGGEEYVARALHTAMSELNWRDDPEGLRMVFVAGNESAEQDPEISLQIVSADARQRDIIVNTLYCGAAEDSLSPGWAQVAQLAGGYFNAIDPSISAVADVQTPFDQPLLELNKKLNETYLGYGSRAPAARENQLAQDANAEAMSAPAAASRTVAKASAMYDSKDWDLVGALESGVELGSIEEEELPAEMKAMSPDERVAHVTEQSEKRDAIREEIEALDRKRQDYLAEKRQEKNGETGLDTAVRSVIRLTAEKKGFQFDSPSGDQ